MVHQPYYTLYDRHFVCYLRYAVLDSSFNQVDEIDLILHEMGSKYRLRTRDYEQNVIDSYFKVVKLRLSYTDGTDYCKIKLRTLIGCFGYKRRSVPLVEYMAGAIQSLGLKTYLSNRENCDIGAVSLDKMIIIRLQ